MEGPPPNLSFERASPRIPLEEWKIKEIYINNNIHQALTINICSILLTETVTASIPWPNAEARRTLAISFRAK